MARCQGWVETDVADAARGRGGMRLMTGVQIAEEQRTHTRLKHGSGRRRQAKAQARTPGHADPATPPQGKKGVLVSALSTSADLPADFVGRAGDRTAEKQHSFCRAVLPLRTPVRMHRLQDSSRLSSSLSRGHVGRAWRQESGSALDERSHADFAVPTKPSGLDPEVDRDA